jgi:hypothetical protein
MYEVVVCGIVVFTTVVDTTVVAEEVDTRKLVSELSELCTPPVQPAVMTTTRAINQVFITSP